MSIPNLPTDNLYKMMAIAGISLCIAAIAIAWKVIDVAKQTSITQIESHGPYLQNIVKIQSQYRTLTSTFETMETLGNRLLNGVNIEAAQESKGGPPPEFPSLAESLAASTESHGIKFGTPSLPKLEFSTPSRTIVRLGEKLDSHRSYVARFLAIPNLPSSIDPTFKADVQQQLSAMDKDIEVFRSLAIEFVANEKKYVAVCERLNYDNQSRIVLIYISVTLFLLGIHLAIIAMLKWYNHVQRFEDLKKAQETVGQESNEANTDRQPLKLSPPVTSRDLLRKAWPITTICLLISLAVGYGLAKITEFRPITITYTLDEWRELLQPYPDVSIKETELSNDIPSQP